VTEDVTVSCLQVSLPIPERLAGFKRSVRDYCRQTHPRRELVIVLDHGHAQTRSTIASYLDSLGRDDIRLVRPAGNLSLGALRNISLDNARGAVVCQWDDDDFHHPQRIQRQLEAMVAADAESVHLEEIMQFFTDTRTLYCTNWRATDAKAVPGTLMCRRSAPIRYPEAGHGSRFGEDSAVSLQLLARRGYSVLARAPHLYVYVSHRHNLWDDGHHRTLARQLGLSCALLRRRAPDLREGLRPFDFGPGRVQVTGYNGPAFSLFEETGLPAPSQP